MSTTLRTGPLPRIGSTRSLASSSTRAMSEPKMAVAPPAGAVMIVTVFAFMASRFGRVHVSSGRGTPGGGTVWAAAVAAALNRREAAKSLGRRDMAEAPSRLHGAVSGCSKYGGKYDGDKMLANKTAKLTSCCQINFSNHELLYAGMLGSTGQKDCNIADLVGPHAPCRPLFSAMSHSRILAGRSPSWPASDHPGLDRAAR